ncbi:MAG: hypothetical protein ACT4TC_07645 [Myxococcaceae bacterium]
MKFGAQFLAVALSSLTWLACGASNGVDDADGTVELAHHQFNLAVVPAVTNVAPGQAAQLVASVTGDQPVGVVWTIEGGDGRALLVPNGASVTFWAPRSEGVYRVSATAVTDATKKSVSTVVVTSAPRSSIRIHPEPVSNNAVVTLRPAASQTFTAYSMTGVSQNALVPVPEARWSIVPGPSVGGHLSDDGNFTAPNGQGTVFISAAVPSDPARSAIKEVQIATWAPPSLVVVPAVSRIRAYEQIQLSAQSSHEYLPVSWSVVSSGASVTPNGVFTAFLPGVYVVRATTGRTPAALGTIVVQ